MPPDVERPRPRRAARGRGDADRRGCGGISESQVNRDGIPEQPQRVSLGQRLVPLGARRLVRIEALTADGQAFVDVRLCVRRRGSVIATRAGLCLRVDAARVVADAIACAVAIAAPATPTPTKEPVATGQRGG